MHARRRSPLSTEALKAYLRGQARTASDSATANTQAEDLLEYSHETSNPLCR
jgi:hypothetical protein